MTGFVCVAMVIGFEETVVEVNKAVFPKPLEVCFNISQQSALTYDTAVVLNTQDGLAGEQD